MEHRKIGTIRTELATAKREWREFVRRIGDDMGCDGTRGENDGYRWDVMNLEDELAEALAAREQKRG